MGRYSFLVKQKGDMPIPEIVDGHIAYHIEAVKDCQREVDKDFFYPNKPPLRDFKKGERYAAVYMHTGVDEERLRHKGYEFFGYCVRKEDVEGRKKCFKILPSRKDPREDS